jgi:hypothetical protein
MAVFRRSLIALLLLAQCAAANTIVSAGGNGRFYTTNWYWFITYVNNSQGPYFDVRSDDGPATGGAGCNIGHYVIGPSSVCSAENQPGGVDRFNEPNYEGPNAGTWYGADYWVAGSGANSPADQQFDFESSSQSFTVELMAAASTNATNNELGIYSWDSNNVYTELLLLSGESMLDPVTFTPGSSRWGFFLNNGTTKYYMNYTHADPNHPATQHFAVFRDPDDPHNSSSRDWQTLWIGVEDGTGANDYNDLILRVTPTPEVGTSWLVAGGAVLIGVSRLGHRRRSRSKGIR